MNRAPGNPVALHQPLYTAFFADRVEVPVTTAARIVRAQDFLGISLAEGDEWDTSLKGRLR